MTRPTGNRNRNPVGRPVADPAGADIKELARGGFWLAALSDDGDPNVIAIREDAAPWLATCDTFAVVDVLASTDEPEDRRLYRGPSLVDADSIARWYVDRGGDRRCRLNWRRTDVGAVLHRPIEHGEILYLASGAQHVTAGKALPLTATA